MAHVYRKGGRSGSITLENIKWADLTRPEKVRVGYRRIASLTAIAALAPIVPNATASAIGNPNEQLAQAAQETPIFNAISKSYTDAATAEKYQMSFITPLRAKSDDTYIEGNGLSATGGLNFKRVTVRVGRSCLAGTAYDTTPYRGDASAVAALQVNGDRVTVHPAGSEAKPLSFTVLSSGQLEPSKATGETLHAYDCQYLGSIPVRTSIEKDDENLNWVYRGSLNDLSQ